MSKFSSPLMHRPLQRPAAAFEWQPAAAAPAPVSGHIGMLTVLLGSYALMCTVPVAELLITHVGIYIPVVWIAYAILTLGLFTTGHILDFWKLPMAKPYMIMLGLFAAAAVFGLYPTRSFSLVFAYGFRFHMLPFYCCAIAVSTKQVRHVFSWLAWGALILLLLCFAYGQMSEDRFIIPNSTLANPNDLGFAILFVMTGLLVLQSKFSRLLVALSMPVFLLYVLKTGSRADLITLISLGAVAFYFAPRTWKIVILACAPIVGAGTVAFVPSQTLARLTTIVSNPSTTAANTLELRGAMDSQAARAQLQERAIQLSLRHPLLGVGVTNFEDAIDDMIQKTLHEKSGWQVAHNTYLQVAAENGLPAFICYVWSLFATLKLNYRSYRSCRATPQLSAAVTQSFALILMTFMFLICTAFSNNSCDPHLGVLVGLSAANYLAVQREMKAAQQDIAAKAGLAPAPWKQPVQRRPAAPPMTIPKGSLA